MKLVTFLNHVTTHIAVRTYWRLSISSLITIFECMTLCVTMWTVRPFFPLVCEISLSCVKRGMKKTYWPMPWTHKKECCWRVGGAALVVGSLRTPC